MTVIASIRSITIGGRAAQVISFTQAGQLEEIRIESWCDDGRASFRIESVATSGAPSGTLLRDATFTEISPRAGAAENGAGFDALVLASPLPVRPGDRIALVASETVVNGCVLQRNLERTHAGGNLYGTLTDGSWTIADGAINFQTLLSP